MSNNTYELTVREVVRETPDTVSVYFEHPPEGPIPYKSGQYLTLILNFDGEEVRRAYSICTSPSADDYMGFSVKRLEGGLVSNYLNDHAKPGDTMKIMEPMGSFTLPQGENKKRHIVLVGAGSGITPLWSIAKTTLHSREKDQVSLIYANRNFDAVIYREQLEQKAKEFPGKFNFISVIKNPPEGWDGPVGRLNPDLLGELLYQATPSEPFDETHYYTCGPEGIMDMFIKHLKEKNVDDDFIHRESFSAVVTEDEKAQAREEFNIQTQTVTIIYEEEEYEIEVPPEMSILDAAYEEGIDLPYSCQSGICTSCMGKLQSGKTHMDHNEALTDDEVAQGYTLTCVSHPLTDDVVIEME